MKLFSKQSYILLADLLILFFSLILVLFLRYPNNVSSQLSAHLLSFGPFFFIVVLIFFGFDLYEPIYFRFDKDFLASAFSALILSFFIGIGYFYLGKPLGLLISPYTNFIIFYIIFSALFLWSRQFLFRKIKPKRLISFVGKQDPLLEEIKTFFANNRHLGFELKNFDNFKSFNQRIKSDFLVTNLSASEITLTNFYSLTNFSALENFYIYLFRKIPIKFLDKGKILELVFKEPPAYYFLIKRIVDIIIVVPALVFTAILTPFIVIGIKLSSSGPVFIRQKRVGRFENIITIYKFRTMHQAEEIEDFWTETDNPRIFAFGKFLRRTHLDELPQAVNILRGEITLIGPRAENINVIEDLKNKVPYIQLRHLARPGITGLAQLSYGYGASVEDYIHKISYDLYYVANRSLIFDLLILLKTIKEIIQMRGR
ncbi:MAG TPA: sugar transferase [Candidatus Humimicrobiaceae bacterium]|nr:sugar transferase [Candidatus Humimicrobiaceae bacterium]